MNIKTFFQHMLGVFAPEEKDTTELSDFEKILLSKEETPVVRIDTVASNRDYQYFVSGENFSFVYVKNIAELKKHHNLPETASDTALLAVLQNQMTEVLKDTVIKRLEEGKRTGKLISLGNEREQTTIDPDLIVGWTYYLHTKIIPT